MSKQVFVIFSDYPFGTNNMSEKLRLAVGMTLCDENTMSLVFLGNSRHALRKLDETKTNMKPIFKHIEMLIELGVKFYVEEGSNFSIINNIECQCIQANEFNDLLDKANVVIH